MSGGIGCSVVVCGCKCVRRDEDERLEVGGGKISR